MKQGFPRRSRAARQKQMDEQGYVHLEYAPPNYLQELHHEIEARVGLGPGLRPIGAVGYADAPIALAVVELHRRRVGHVAVERNGPAPPPAGHRLCLHHQLLSDPPPPLLLPNGHVRDVCDPGSAFSIRGLTRLVHSIFATVHGQGAFSSMFNFKIEIPSRAEWAFPGKIIRQRIDRQDSGDRRSVQPQIPLWASGNDGNQTRSRASRRHGNKTAELHQAAVEPQSQIQRKFEVREEGPAMRLRYLPAILQARLSDHHVGPNRHIDAPADLTLSYIHPPTAHHTNQQLTIHSNDLGIARLEFEMGES